MDGLIPQTVIDEAEAAAREARFPIGRGIEFADLELDSRVSSLDRLRDFEPISWVPALGGWLVTSHELARELLGRGADFTVLAEPNLVRASLGVMMLTSDGAEHERQRRPFDEPFRVRSVRERFAEPVKRHIDALVAELSPIGRCELVEDFAAPFAIGLAGDVLGLPLDDVARVQEFYEAFAGAMVYDGDPEPQRRADAARAALNAILLEEVRRSRARPDNSITSAVANDPARGLSDEEIVAQLRVILFGAIETVESTIANAVLLLLQHPDQLEILRAEPGVAGNAIEEGMRLIPPVAFIERWTAAPCELGGIGLAEGEFLGVSTVAANRDPVVFPAPERFDVRRGNARHHLTLSHGHHHCLGFNLGRMQCQMAVTALFDRLPGLEIVHAPEPTGFAFRRPATLQLRWDG
jgi:cytochrome P450